MALAVHRGRDPGRGGDLARAPVERPESPIKTQSRLDLPGAVLLAGSLTALLVALTEGEGWGWTSLPFLGLMLASAVLLATWILAGLRIAEPMVDMRMMSERPCC